MKAGEVLTDTDGGRWTIEASPKRTLTANLWPVRGPAGRQAIARVPHAAAAFPDHADADALAGACAEQHRALTALYRGDPPAWLPKLVGEASTTDGAEVLLLPPPQSTLARRIDEGWPLTDVVGSLRDAAAALARGTSLHGDLRAEHLHIFEEGRVALAEPLLAPAWPHRAALEATAGLPSAVPPETGHTLKPDTDTWSLCLALFQACLFNRRIQAADPDAVPRVRAGGLDRVTLSSARASATSRMEHEAANPRFVSRAAEALSSLLDRGLSKEWQSSPPYRFARPADLHERLTQLHDLLHPSILKLADIRFGTVQKNNTFDAGKDVELWVRADVTFGVKAPDDLVTGIALRDIDAPGDGRVRAPELRYTVKHYGQGQWRVRFIITNLPPARYEINVALQLKGTEKPPLTVSDRFDVRPGPGYVPPPPEAAPQVDTSFEDRLRKRRQQAESTPQPQAPLAHPQPEPDAAPEPPRPLAPSSAGDAPEPWQRPVTDVEAEDPPEPSTVGATVIPGVQPRPVAPPAELLPDPTTLSPESLAPAPEPPADHQPFSPAQAPSPVTFASGEPPVQGNVEWEPPSSLDDPSLPGGTDILEPPDDDLPPPPVWQAWIDRAQDALAGYEPLHLMMGVMFAGFFLLLAVGALLQSCN